MQESANSRAPWSHLKKQDSPPLPRPRPPFQTADSPPSQKHVYKTSQFRRNRFTRIGSCRSAPLVLEKTAKEATSETKSQSSTNIVGKDSINDAQSDDHISSCIKHYRASLGLETRASRVEMPFDRRESLLASSCPITGVRDLKVLSRRLSGFSSPAKRDSTVEFVYAVTRDSKKVSVYDLCIIEPDKVRAQESYYTISAFNVSKINKEGEMECISSLRWLWEREIFHRISTIPYFKNFMIRKAFGIWHHWICSRKTFRHLVTLRSSLFTADSLLQKAILEVQSVCESASSSSLSHYLESKGVDITREIKLISVEGHLGGCTYTLEHFASLQQVAVSQAQKQLFLLRETIVSIIASVCQEVVDQKGIQELCSHTTEESVVPTHTLVLEWRATMERLERFTRLCGELVVQLLQRLVFKAVSTLLFLMKKLVRHALDKAANLDEQFRVMQEKVTSNPYTQGILDRQDISLDEEDEDHMGLVSMQASSFSTLVPSIETGAGSLSTLVESVTSTPTLDGNSDLLEDSLDQKFILPLWEVKLTLGDQGCCASNVSFSPSLDQFQSVLNDLLKKYEQVLKDFKSLSFDNRILPYVGCSGFDVLKTLKKEEDIKNETPIKEWIDCQSMLHNYAPYHRIVSQLNKCLALSLAEVKRKLAHYECYSKMVTMCNSANIASSTSFESWSVPTFQRTFALHHDQMHGMKGMLVSFQVGVMEVKASDFQTACLAHPQRILTLLEDKLPKIAGAICDQLSTQMKVFIEKLSNTPSDVTNFVQYLEDVDNVISSVSLIEKNMLTATNMHNVAQHFEVEVPVEEIALYKSLFPQFRHLKNILMQAQAAKAESVHQFSTDLKKLVVEVLKQTSEIKTAIESLVQPDDLLVSPLEALREYESQLDTLLVQAKQYVNYHNMFSSIPSSTRRFHAMDPSATSWTPEEVCDEVLNVFQALKARQALFQIRSNWNNKLTQWRGLAISSLNMSELHKEVNVFVNQVDYLEKELSSSNKMVSKLQAEVTEFRSLLPTLSCLLNPVLKMRHWEVIQKAMGEEPSLVKGHSLSIDSLQQINVFDRHTVIASVSNEANHEASIENMLKKISVQWMDRELVLVAHKGVTERPTHVLAGVNDLLASIEDSLLTINTIRGSRYVNPVKHSVLDWQRRLLLMLETVQTWMRCQKNWLYLESIFATVDLQRQLFIDAKLFLQADKLFREVIKVAAEKPTALKATSTPGVLESFEMCNVLFEQVFKSLEDFLEIKRMGFPRFYFISDEELLDIIAHTKQPLSIQVYLEKLFTSVKKLEADIISPVAATVHTIVSNEREKFQLCKSVNARGAPEKWLCLLNIICCETVKLHLKEGVQSYDEDSRVTWAVNIPGQVAHTIALTKWTEQVECCFSSDSPVESLNSLLSTWNSHIIELSKVWQTQEKTGLQIRTLASLLTQDVHCRDVIQYLIQDQVTNANNFQWIRHLRHYWDNESHCVYLLQLCARFSYANEYIGNLPRLVVTPLTERCYLTLTTALHLHLGGMLLGPAGTGKSETIKDLARVMGRFCLLINCSESLEYKAIGQLYSGLCQSGSWCCFDEFNRIRANVLSILAQQLKCIKEAKEKRAVRFVFEGREIKMDSSCGAFITMNPSYIGRVELPDNVKMFFRPIAMMEPDTAVIAEVLLLSSGFVSASSLAVKMTKFFEFMESQVSDKVYYDFGLRAVKAVVTAARANLLHSRQSKLIDCNIETKSLVLAIVGVNAPKLLARDCSVMFSLIKDLFGMNLSNKVHTNHQTDLLMKYLENAAIENSLEISEVHIFKCIQLYRCILLHHGVIIMGSSGTGKSTIIKLLKIALNMACKTLQSGHVFSSAISSSSSKVDGSNMVCCDLKTINPKSISLEKLYGFMDSNTLEWKNGILPTVLKEFCCQLPADHSSDASIQSKKSSTNSPEQEISEEGGEHSLCVQGDGSVALCFPPEAPVGWRWIVMDGPVDPLWIENLNTTLDDSKVLCLANNERISLPPGLRLLFETDSLEYASPATVSRCGIILMDDQLLCWQSYTVSWIKQLPKEFPEECGVLLTSLFNQSIEESVVFLKANKSQLCCPLPAMGAVKTLCLLLRSLIDSLLKERPQLCKNQSETVSCPTKSEQSSSSIGVQTLAGIYIPTKSKLSGQDKDSTNHLEGRSPLSELSELIAKLYVFAFVWAFGGCIESAEDDDCMDGLINHQVTRGGRTLVSKFDALTHKLFGSVDCNVHVKLPTAADSIFSYYVDIYKSAFVTWRTLIPSPKQIATRISFLRKGLGNLGSTFSSPFFNDSKFSMSNLTAANVPLIPTVPTVQLAYLGALLSFNPACSLLFVGKTGVGKTQFLNYLVDMLPSVKKRSAVMSSVCRTGASKSYTIPNKFDQSYHDDSSESDDLGFQCQLSTYTTSQKLQSMIESHCIRTGLSLWKPAWGEKVIAFLDDLHLPTSDEFGTQQCSELLRQLHNKRGWYDRKNLAWKNVCGVQLVATCGRKGWAPAVVNERCLSNYCVFSLPEPSSETLQSVYSAHLSTAFTTNKFTDEVVKSVQSVVSCAVFMYGEVATLLPPSLSNPQYTFSIKDLSKVFSRILYIHHRSVKTIDDVIQLLSHEFQRVFRDKCFPEDRESILKILAEGLRIYFKVVIPVSKLRDQFLLYEGFTSTTSGYTSVKSLKKLAKSLERVQNQYNLTQDKSLQLSFFPQVCEHILRISRVLQQPNGNMILIGESGLGKKSCAQLATYIANCSYSYLKVSEESLGEALEEIRSMVMQCGVNEQPTCLLLTENLGSLQDDLLCVINELVRGGDFESLFSEEEVESIVSQLSEVLTVKQGTECKLSPRELWELFVKQVFWNLHTILCVTPSSPLLALLYKKYQSVFTYSTIDVFDEWSSKALFGVAMREMTNCDMSQKVMDIAAQLATIAVKIHGVSLSALSKAHSLFPLSFTITPTTFIKFIRMFCRMVSEKESRIITQRSRLEAGLLQLRKTNNHVDKLRSELSCIQPEVESKTKEVESLLSRVAVEQQQLDILRYTVAEERAVLAKETEEVHRLKQEAEEDLISVLPALKEAENGLKALQKQHFDEIRSYVRPPPMVVHVMSAVCLLLGQPTDWQTAKQISRDGSAFLKSLYTFNKENVSDKVLANLKNFTRDENFTPKKVALYSTACQSFCKWVLAVQEYAEVYRIVQPKRIVYQEVRDKLAVVKEKLSEKESHLIQLEQELAELETQHRAKSSERNQLQQKYDDISVKIERAECVIHSLTDEQNRWSTTHSSLKLLLRTMIGDSLVTAACLTYLGPYIDVLRLALISKWKQLCLENKLSTCEKFKLEENVGNMEQIQHWYVSGLPKDTHSVQSAIIATQANSTPLITDPQGQASRWLKLLYSADLKILQFDSDGLIKDVMESVTTGTPVLVEGVMGSSCLKLEPFLTNHVHMRAGQMLLRVNKTDISYNSNFRLFLICSSSGTVFTSEICNKTTVVDFTITADSLKEQLLSTTIQLIQPQLDATYSELVMKIMSDKEELQYLEEELLNLLKKSKGILEDKEVLTTLQNLKKLVTIVKEKLELAKLTEREITSAKNQYLGVATRGSLLYSELQGLHLLSPMYKFSMDWFQEIFSDCLENTKVHKGSFQEELIQRLTATVIRKASYCILADHYTAFVLRVCCSININENKVSSDEWKAMIELVSILRGTNKHLDNKACGNSSSTFNKLNLSSITQRMWDAVSYLENFLPCFEGLKNHIAKHSQMWVELMSCCNPITYLDNMADHQEFFPSHLNIWQKLMLVQVLCPDKYLLEVKSYIGNQLGSQYQEKQVVCISEVIKCTTNRKPILLMLSDGLDPNSVLEGISQHEDDNIVTVYPSGGQDKRMLEILHFAAKKGRWIIVENCHLVVPSIIILQNHLDSLNSEGQLHSSFRLFLCSHPNALLPDPLISACVKVCLEPTKSIKSSMKQLFSDKSWVADKFEGCSVPSSCWKQLVFNMCLFHSALNSRRRFDGTATKTLASRYFQVSDLQVSINLLNEVIGQVKQQFNGWDVIKYIVDLCYGGSTTHTYDKSSMVKLLHMYLLKWTTIPYFLHGIDGIQPSELFFECNKRIDKLLVQDLPEHLGISQETWLSFQARQSIGLQKFLCQMDSKHGAHKVAHVKNEKKLVLEKASLVIDKLQYIKFNDYQRQGLTSLYTDWISSEVMEWKNSLLFIEESLQKIVDRIKKGGMLSDDQEAVGCCLIKSIVPQCWIFGKPTISISQWLEYLSNSVSYISRLLSRTLSLKCTPLSFQLSAIASPKALFRFLKQYLSREMNIPLEKIQLRVMLASETSESLCVTLNGIAIEGGTFCKESGLTATTDAGTSPMELKCCPMNESDNSRPVTLHKCLIYSSRTRANVVSSVWVPIAKAVSPLESALITAFFFIGL